MKYFTATALLILATTLMTSAQTPAEIDYGYPVQYIHLEAEGQDMTMAYMDIHPTGKTNGKAVLLLHGKNFNGFYWKDVAKQLAENGYRVVVPDQVGWGKSSHPNIHYSFRLLAQNTRRLLDTLGVNKVFVVGHSMGGMLATRFCLMYPEYAEKLVLENPIGLEDYKTFVPYVTIDEQYKKEAAATYESYKKYQQSYYPEWKPIYEPLVKAQAAALHAPDFKQIAFVNALTFEMICEQPVCHEFENLRMPATLIIGQADRTVVGKNLLTDKQKAAHGQYPALGKRAAQAIKNAKLVELEGVGHIPHIQVPEIFMRELFAALK